MFIPDMALYTQLSCLLNCLLGSPHRASLRSVTDLLWALLAGQSIHPADLSRSLPDIHTSRARQAMRRTRRIIGRSLLSSSHLTPLLLGAVLRLLPDKPLFLVLDSTRCRRWEIFTLGIRVRGRVLPIAWRVLPYPWPKGKFTPTVIELLRGTLGIWPASRPVHLLADRGFPSLKLFRELEMWRKRIALDYTIRLRAGDWVRMDGQSVKLARLMADAKEGIWQRRVAVYQQRGKVSAEAMLVIGKGVPIYPAHQRGPADEERRAYRAKRRLAHLLLSKKQPHSAVTDTVWALFSTAKSYPHAIKYYGYRFSTEGMYRDVKGWGLEGVAGREADSAHLDGLMGLASVGYLVQAAIGMEAGRAREKCVRARRKQWSTTGRLSVFWYGRQVLLDHAYDWRAWLGETLDKLQRRISDGQIGTSPEEAGHPAVCIRARKQTKEAA